MNSLFVFLVVGILVFVLWGMIEVNKVKHKIYAIVLIGILLFIFISGTTVFKNKNIDFTSVDGIFQAGKIYFSFLGNIGKNVFSITANAVNMDWSIDEEDKNSSV